MLGFILITWVFGILLAYCIVAMDPRSDD